MSAFILTFRGATGRTLSEADGAAWMAWFGCPGRSQGGGVEIGELIAM